MDEITALHLGAYALRADAKTLGKMDGAEKDEEARAVIAEWEEAAAILDQMAKSASLDA